ncbi:MAG: hypothetical protein JWQ71_3758 [Pedosphaera sp.]|nr:hypothetical protein [Pedosphaera sp.]
MAMIHPGITNAAVLVQYWPFDELPGTTFSSNRVAGGNSAFLVNANTNAAWITSGLAPQLTNSTGAVTLDGINDYVNLGVFGLNNPATLSMWLKPNDFSGDVRLFSPLDFNATYAGLVRFDTFGSGAIQEISNISGTWPNIWYNLANISVVPVGQWTHLALVYAPGGIVSLYINGVRSGQIFGGFRFAQSQFGLGAQFNGGGKSFSGAIDDMSVWNGALSPNSIAQLAAGASPTNIVDVAPVQPGANLVQYFQLDDGIGSATAANAVAGGNTGNLVSLDPNTQWTSDKPSQLTNSLGSLVFDGTGYVDLGNIHLFGSGAVSLWLKPATNNIDMRIYAQLSGLANNPGNVSLDIPGVGGLGVYNSAANARIAPAGVVPTNQWTHLVISYDNGYATAYINGVPQITTPAVFAFGADSFGLGANFRLATGGKFRGSIDDVSIWDRPLSSTSIQQLAAGVSPLSILDTPQQPPVNVSLSISITNLPGTTIRQYFPLEGPDNSTNVANLSGTNAAFLVNYVAPPVPWTSTALAPQLSNNVSAMVVDGGTTYGNLGNIGLSGSATVSLWAKPASVTGAPGGTFLFSQLNGSTAAQGAIGITGTGGLLVRGPAPNIAPNGTLKVGEWIHLAFVYDAGSLTTYTNGVAISTTSVNFQFDAAPLGIGASLWHLSSPVGAPFNGQLDDFAVWNAPLSADEIQSLAQGQSPIDVPSSASLVQYFPLNGTGTNLAIANQVAGGNVGVVENYSPTARSWDSTVIPAALASRSTRSLFMDGFNDYVNMRNIGQTGSGTVSFWVNFNLLPGDTRLFSQLTGGTGQPGTSTVRANGEIWIWNGGTWQVVAGPNTLTTNRWYHLAYTYGGGLATLYVDGVEKNTVAAGFTFSPIEFGLGAKFIAQNGATLSGYVDDVSIWSGALAPATIKQLAGGAAPNSVVDKILSVRLAWAAYPGGYYNVQTSTSLSGPWTPISQSATLAGTNYTVFVPISTAGSKFFRLVKP